MEQSSENCNYSVNDLWAEYSSHRTKNEKVIVTTVVDINSRDEKIYTKTDFQKALDFVCLKEVQNNPFCGKENCFDILPNHHHSKELEEERKSKILPIIKTNFFIDKWLSITKSEKEKNKFEKEISQRLGRLEMTNDKEEIKKIIVWFSEYIKNIETHILHSPKLKLIEKKWRNKKVREEWLKNGRKFDFRDQWQILQLTVVDEERNLFSSPTNWISTAIVLSLAAIGWVFYRRRKTTKKKQSKTNARINF